MSDEINHGTTAGHGNYERQDLKPSGILYFLLALGAAILLCIVGIKGLYSLLDRREKATQPAVNPLIADLPKPTFKTKKDYDKYLEKSFPDPRLETDERNQLDKESIREEGLLYSYGWVDEKAGTVHIPIERAMDLLVQRGLAVRPQSTANENTAAKPETGNKESNKIKAGKKDVKK
jgi:hypothetical protein